MIIYIYVHTSLSLSISIYLYIYIWTKPIRLCIIHMILPCTGKRSQAKIKASKFGALPAANWFGIPAEGRGLMIPWISMGRTRLGPGHPPNKWGLFFGFTNREIGIYQDFCGYFLVVPNFEKKKTALVTGGFAVFDVRCDGCECVSKLPTTPPNSQ